MIDLNRGAVAAATRRMATALLIRMDTCGLNHDSTAFLHFNLGLLYRQQADYERSKKSLRISREIFRESMEHGPFSVWVSNCDVALGQTNFMAQQFKSAYSAFYIAWRTRAKVTY
jgi:hypothetical protein